MIKRPLALIVFLLFLSNASAQIIIENKGSLVSSNAYSKKISKDFNYLLLADNSPQQGISATLNEKKSNLKINGLLYSGSFGVFSIEADLSASNGIYFFDEEKGSEQGKITFNYYKKMFARSEYYRGTNASRAAIKLQILDLIVQADSDYKKLKEIIEENISSPPLTLTEDYNKDVVIKKLKRLTRKYINSQDKDAYDHIKKRKFNEKPFLLVNTKVVTVKEIIKKKDAKKNEKREDLSIGKVKMNMSKVLKAYQDKRKYILKELEKKINDAELENAEAQWAGNHIVFMGISPFYERQSLKRFSYNNSVPFADMFSSEKGNVYGVTLSLNYSLEKGEGSKNYFKPENLFLRLSASLARASNISSFKNSTLNITTPLGNDSNGVPVVFTNSDAAFIGDTGFEYGFSRSFNFEAYYYPFKIPAGLFGKIGYQRIRFNDGSTLDNTEIYPMRLGMLFSLKNKDKKKPLVTIQAFIDRTDLNLKPSEPDSDLRFGIGIGLPINIR